MNFTFTERHATIMTRFMECGIDKWLERVEELKKLSQTDINSLYHSNDGIYSLNVITIQCKTENQSWFRMKIYITFDSSDDEDDDDMTVDGLKMSFIHESKFGPKFTDVYTSFIGEHHCNSLEEAKAKINSKVKTYFYCKCKDRLIVKDEWCEFCYPYVMDQEDNCSVCLENTGVWVELKCKHIIHEYCFQKIENKKCPLCRKVSDKTFKL